MRIPRVFVDQPLQAESEPTLPAAASRHLLQVLRLRAGTELVVFDGLGGEFHATLLGTAKSGARVRVDARLAVERESPLELTLLQGVARGERMDLVVQKAVELGVTRIQPVQCEFSVVRLDAAQAARRRAHWQGIAIAACEQCGRNRVPAVAAPTPLAAALELIGSAARRLMLELDASVTLSAAARGAQSIALLVGPEGGLSTAEQSLCARAGFTAARLGPRVLRTETAPLAALAILQASAGDLA